MIAINKYKRFENETDEEIIFRICSDKDEIGTWQDVADILNEILGTEYNESKFRKSYQAFQKMMSANRSKFTDCNTQLEEINNKIRELEKERKKLQTEKIEYNKLLREEARDEMIIERITDAISSIEPLKMPKPIGIPYNEKGYVLCISDLHYGSEVCIRGLFGEILNEYSPEICEKRMWNLLNKVIRLVKRESIGELHVYNCSDNIDGILRVSQLMKLRYGVVDATIKVSELLANWLNELSKHVRIKYFMTEDGNHDQLRLLGEKKNSFANENMNKIIFEFLNARLSSNPNVEIVKNNTEKIFDTVCGYNILAHHGEVKSPQKSILEFQQMYGVPISFLIGGHMHHSSQEDVGIDAEVINVPSIIGIDDYSISLHKTSNAAAKMFVFEEGEGKVAEYTFKLSE